MIEVLRIQRYVHAAATSTEIPRTSAKRVHWRRRGASSTAARALCGLSRASCRRLLRAWHARSEHDEYDEPDGPCGET
jgi:hypothetical protein